MRLCPAASWAVSGLLTLGFLSGCGGGSGTNAQPVPPLATCANPAPLEGSADEREIRYCFAYFPEGTQSIEQTKALAEKYGFVARVTVDGATAESVEGFGADLTPAVIAALRCEPIIVRMVYDGYE